MSRKEFFWQILYNFFSIYAISIYLICKQTGFITIAFVYLNIHKYVNTLSIAQTYLLQIHFIMNNLNFFCALLHMKLHFQQNVTALNVSMELTFLKSLVAIKI